MKELWTDWPTRELPYITKFYILGQWSFWLQQVLVINIEERRKDYWQMLTHHVVTIGLISTSYAYHFTRIGNLILILMDVVDIFFPVSFPHLRGIAPAKTDVACQVPEVPGLQHPV